MKEAKVKSYTRKTKSGKIVQVKAHSRKCEGGSCADKNGAGSEFKKKVKKKKTIADFIDTENNFDALKEYAAQFMDVDDLKNKDALKERFNKELSGDKTNHRKEFKRFKNEEFFPGKAYDRKVRKLNARKTLQ